MIFQTHYQSLLDDLNGNQDELKADVVVWGLQYLITMAVLQTLLFTRKEKYTSSFYKYNSWINEIEITLKERTENHRIKETSFIAYLIVMFCKQKRKMWLCVMYACS